MSTAHMVNSVREEIEAGLRWSDIDPSFYEMLRRWVLQREEFVPVEKRFRWSLLTLSVCEAISGRWQYGVPAAAAAELFIAAGDALDDLQDRDIGRTVWAMYGEPAVINGATALLILGQRALTRLEDKGGDGARIVLATKAWISAIFRACSGQHSDLQYESQGTVSEDAYYCMTEMKSAGLTECVCHVAAVLSTSDSHIITQYSLFGRNLGMAAQIRNDAQPLLTPHGYKSDIARRKKILPVIYGLRHAEGEERAFLRSVYESRSAVAQETQEKVTEILLRLGAVHYTLVVADTYRQKALQALLDSGIPRQANQKLEALVAPFKTAT